MNTGKEITGRILHMAHLIEQASARPISAEFTLKRSNPVRVCGAMESRLMAQVYQRRNLRGKFVHKHKNSFRRRHVIRSVSKKNVAYYRRRTAELLTAKSPAVGLVVERYGNPDTPLTPTCTCGRTVGVGFIGTICDFCNTPVKAQPAEDDCLQRKAEANAKALSELSRGTGFRFVWTPAGSSAATQEEKDKFLLDQIASNNYHGRN